MHNNGLSRLGHDLHVRMYPFQAPQHPLDGLVLDTFDKNTYDRTGALKQVPLSMEPMMGADVFHSPCGCMSVHWQAWGTTCMSGCIPFRPQSAERLTWFWAHLAEAHRIEMTHYDMCLYLLS